MFLPWSGLWVKYTMMKIIVKMEDFKKTVEKHSAFIKADGKGNLHFVTSYGDIIEYHLPRCNEIKNPEYVKPFHATHEPVNYSYNERN